MSIRVWNRPWYFLTGQTVEILPLDRLTGHGHGQTICSKLSLHIETTFALPTLEIFSLNQKLVLFAADLWE